MEDLRITPKLTLSHKELQITTARSSGPGGQNVNKVNTKATLRWNPFRCDHFPVGWRKRFTEQNCNRMTKEGEIVLQSDRYRDQKEYPGRAATLGPTSCDLRAPPKNANPLNQQKAASGDG